MAMVSEVLAKKGTSVHGVSPSATVLAATQLMNRHKIGALVVTTDPAGDCGRVVGIFTERDVLTRVVAAQRDPKTTRVDEVMSADVAFCTPEMDIDQVGAIMRQRRIRHLPVCEGEGELKGIISIGDINAWRAEGLAITIHYLNEYIHGRV